jgi:uncharacterized protein YqeY
MSVLNALQDEMKAAMKAHDQARLDALRLLVSAIKYFQVDNPNMTDEQVSQVLSKEAKKRREAIEAYKAAGRTESAEKEQFELSLIESYLPKMMSEDEVRAKVKEVIESGSFDNFGTAMNGVMKVIGKDAEGGVVAKIVKELYSNKA